MVLSMHSSKRNPADWAEYLCSIGFYGPGNRERFEAIFKDAENGILMELVAFLNKRAEELHNLGGIHIRESVSLGEAVLMIEQGMWKDYL